METSTTNRTAVPPRLAELDLVRLRFDVAERETLVRAGTIGTIVHVFAGGTAYEVEFVEPSPAVLTLEWLDILPLTDAA